MSPEEKTELATLRYEVNEGFREVRQLYEEGFREVRGLLESRRTQEELAHHDIHARVTQQGERLRQHVEEVEDRVVGRVGMLEKERLRPLERVAWIATILGGVGTLVGMELLRRTTISF